MVRWSFPLGRGGWTRCFWFAISAAAWFGLGQACDRTRDPAPDAFDAFDSDGDAAPGVSPDDIGADTGAPLAAHLEVVSVLDLGSVPRGGDATASLSVTNAGGRPIESVTASVAGGGFSLVGGDSFALPVGATVDVTVRLAPTFVGPTSGVLTLQASELESAVEVTLIGAGAPEPVPAGQLAVSPPTLDLGPVQLGHSVVRTITVSNPGTETTQVSELVVEADEPGLAEAAVTTSPTLPFALAAGEARPLVVSIEAMAAGSLGGVLRFVGSTGAVAGVQVKGLCYEAPAGLALGSPLALEIVGSADNPAGIITAATQDAVVVQAALPAGIEPSTPLVVRLVDARGMATEHQSTTTGSGTVELTLDATSLANGPIEVIAHIEAGSGSAPLFGERQVRAAVKNAGALVAPVFDAPPPAVTGSPVLSLSGTAPAGATLTAIGGAHPVARALPAGEQAFALHVPLRHNTLNALWVCAELDGDAACTTAEVHHYAARSIAGATVTSEPLSDADAEAQLGALGLDDADAYQISEVSICLGTQPPCATFPIAEPTGPGGASCADQPGAVCTVPTVGNAGGGGPLARAFYVPSPQPGMPPLAGALFLSAGMGALDDLFEATLVLTNASPAHDLGDVTAELTVGEGLTALSALLGGVDGPALDQAPSQLVHLGLIPSAAGGDASVGVAHFLMRGDAAGEHPIQVTIEGTVQAAGQGSLREGLPIAGAVADTIAVFGPPRLRVAVHPPADVEAGTLYGVPISITNPSPVRAKHTWLQLALGEVAVFNDPARCDGEQDCCGGALPNHARIRLGELGPGQTVTHLAGILGCIDEPVVSCVQHASRETSLWLEAGGSCSGFGEVASDGGPPPALGPLLQTRQPAHGATLAKDHTTIEAVFATPVISPGNPMAVMVGEDLYNGELANVQPDSLAQAQWSADAAAVQSAAVVPDGTFYVERLHPETQAVIERVPGEISLGTVGGDVFLGAVGGDVFLGTVGGDVFLGTVGGDVFLGTVGGDVFLGTVGGDVFLGTVGGDVFLGSLGGPVTEQMTELSFSIGQHDGVPFAGPHAGEHGWFEPGGLYRVTARGGPNGIHTLDPATGAATPLPSDVSWLVAIDPESPAPPTEPLAVIAVTPADGATGVGLLQPVKLAFNRAIAPSGLSVGQGSDYLGSQVALVAGATLAGDLVGGAAISVQATLAGDDSTLLLTPAQPLVPGAQYFVRVWDVHAIEGPPLDGLFIAGFATAAATPTPIDPTDCAASCQQLCGPFGGAGPALSVEECTDFCIPGSVAFLECLEDFGCDGDCIAIAPPCGPVCPDDPKACGDDGCGGSCGTCGGGEECGPSNVCVHATPTPIDPTDCAASCQQLCGPFGGAGPALSVEECTDFCIPGSVAFLECLEDFGCDGDCIAIAPPCGPVCADDPKACGDDGCGGSCGTCGGGEECGPSKVCEQSTCVGICMDSEKACGDDGCGGSCGTCDVGEQCISGECEPDD